MGRPSLVKDHVNYITKIENITKHIKNTIFRLIYQFLVHYMVVNYSTSFGSVFVAQMKALGTYYGQKRYRLHARCIKSD